MKRLLVPVLLLTCVTAEAAPTQKQLRECLSIDDMTKERLDCYDKLVPPEPKATTRKARSVSECRFIKEEDARLICFNGFTAGTRSSGSSKPIAAPVNPGAPKGSPKD
jgi:hypothetical protein